MKTLINIGKGNFKIVSEKLVFAFAAALLTIVNVNAENKLATSEAAVGSKVHDTAIAHPVSVTGDQNTTDTISQDVKVTEATLEPAAPLLPGKSQEEIIAGDNLVIEAKSAKEIFPLDFKKINGLQKKNKKATIKNSGRLMGAL